MKIQSLSIHVPTNKCINKCRYCVSRLHESPYTFLQKNSEHKEFKNEYEKRLQFVKDNGVNNLIITGEGEALQNPDFLITLSMMINQIGFQWVELQTSGNFLLNENPRFKFLTPGNNNPNLKFIKEYLKVSTISLSVPDIFNDKDNWYTLGIPYRHRFNLFDLCQTIIGENLNLRISINMLSKYRNFSFSEIFDRLKFLGADQVTFRKLYENGDNSEISTWIRMNSIQDEKYFKELNNYIKNNGRYLGKLPFGASKYSVNEISTVVDDNCMDEAEEREEPDTYKYLILRPNGKLYSNWEDQGSLIF